MSRRLETCGRVALLLICFAIWLGVPVLVRSVKEAEGGCVSDDVLEDGDALNSSHGYFDLFLFATRFMNSAIRSSTGFYIFFTAICIIWTVAANGYIAYAAFAHRRDLSFHMKVFVAFMTVETACSLMFWRPPMNGYVLLDSRFLHYFAGFSAACVGQQFSGRLAWVIFVSYDFCISQKYHRFFQAYHVATALLSIVSLCYLLASRNIDGIGCVLTLFAAIFACARYYELEDAKHTLSSDTSMSDATDEIRVPDDIDTGGGGDEFDGQQQQQQQQPQQGDSIAMRHRIPKHAREQRSRRLSRSSSSSNNGANSHEVSMSSELSPAAAAAAVAAAVLSASSNAQHDRTEKEEEEEHEIELHLDDEINKERDREEEHEDEYDDHRVPLVDEATAVAATAAVSLPPMHPADEQNRDARVATAAAADS